MTRLFAHEGVVQVAQSPGNLAKLATLDAATELAIDIGAEEVAEGALQFKTYRVRVLYILVLHRYLRTYTSAQVVETCIRVTPNSVLILMRSFSLCSCSSSVDRIRSAYCVRSSRRAGCRC